MQTTSRLQEAASLVIFAVSVFALVALGYTMVYGILEFINFAHGDVFMLAGFLALTLIGLRLLAGLSASGRLARRIDASFEKALTISFIVWILGAFAFYIVALHLERQKQCADQRTTQLTYECRKLFGQKD